MMAVPSFFKPSNISDFAFAIPFLDLKNSICASAIFVITAMSGFAILLK